MLYELAKTADVFLTNYLPAAAPEEQVRRRAHPRGQPEHHLCPRQRLRRQGTGARDRRLRRHCVLDAQRHRLRHDARPSSTAPLGQGIPAFGDSIGGMFIAGGISAALFHRERTGEARRARRVAAEHRLVGGGRALAQVMETGRSSAPPCRSPAAPAVNPFMGNYRTSDGGTINLCILSPTGLHPRHVRAPRPPRGGRRSALLRRAR